MSARFDRTSDGVRPASRLKKAAVTVVLLAACASAALLLLYLSTGTTPSMVWAVVFEKSGTSGEVTLTVDGRAVAVDGVPVVFTYDGTEPVSKSGTIRDGKFNFSDSQYGFYYLSFSLDPSMWGGEGQAVHFEIEHFCTYNRALTKFDIHISVDDTGMIELETTVKVRLSDGTVTYSDTSDKTPVDPSGMTISVST